MINKALYTKYRPLKFSDIYGQGYISQILRNQIKTKKFTHAYLFSGTRGTGKTTCARIFSRAINCLNPINGDPCNECSMCIKTNELSLNIIELDAASNNSVEQIRNLIEELKYLNFMGEYKVYILDEVHMLSVSAFNALLKTLEEPPSNVVFILSTTELKKIPITVISRCQRFEFKNIDNRDIFNRLKYICDNEKINICNESLELISYMGNGSMRDSISILEQVLFFSHKECDMISVENVRKILGISSNELVLEFLYNIINMDLEKSIISIVGLVKNNISIKNFILDFKNVLRDLLFTKVNNIDYDLLIEKNKDIIDKIKNFSQNLSIKYILFLMDGINEISEKKINTEGEYKIYLELFSIKVCNYKDENLQNLELRKSNTMDDFQEKSNTNISNTKKTNNLTFNWVDFLIYIKKNSFMVIYSLLQNGEVKDYSNSRIIFKCKTQGINNRLKDKNIVKQIEMCLKEFYGESFIFESFVDDENSKLTIENKVREFFGSDIQIETK